MTALQCYFLGVWTVIGLVIGFEWLKAQRTRRQERELLTRWGTLLGIQPGAAESNRDLRERITARLRMHQ